MMIKNMIRLMRPKHYVKNILILLPLVFSGSLRGSWPAGRAAAGLGAFCLLSSAVYIINDLHDAPADRNHPRKKNRPIASGAVPPGAAAGLAVLLGLLVVALGLLARFSLLAWAWLAVYLGINVGYSLGLKNVPLLDLAILVSGFLVRLLFGAALFEIEISGWLYLTVISAAFYLGLGKRRGELRTTREGDTRQVLKYYSYDFLDRTMYMCMTLTIVFYSLWSVISETAASRPHLVWTVPVVILICLKYSMTVEGASDGDPAEVIWQDKPLLIMAVSYAVLTLVLLYV